MNQPQTKAKGRVAAMVLLIISPIISIIFFFFFALVTLLQSEYGVTPLETTAVYIHGIATVVCLLGWVPFSSGRYKAAFIMSLIPIATMFFFFIVFGLLG